MAGRCRAFNFPLHGTDFRADRSSDQWTEGNLCMDYG